MFMIIRNAIFIGNILFSMPACASLGAIQLLLDNLNFNQELASGYFIVESDNINASSIKHYLSNAVKTTGCDEKVMPVPEDCKKIGTCSPEIKFIKINPTKYSVKIFNACRDFTLIFNERFDSMWKAYITKTQDAKSEGNQNFDTIKVENFYNTILNLDDLYLSKENSKLPNRRIWETWFSGTLAWKLHSNTDTPKSRDSSLTEQKSWNVSKGFNDESMKWPDLLHWESNAYANGWMFDLQGIKSLPLPMNNKNSFYSINSDGSLNFDVIIEYWPQRIYYLSYLISGFSILLCISIAIFMRFREVRLPN